MSEIDESEDKGKSFLWGLGVFTLVVILGMFAVASYWSIEPEPFDAVDATLKATNLTDSDLLPDGAVYANTLAQIADRLLNKPGGYLTNDVAPPSILMDNMPSWEHGALVMLRDATSGLRNHFSRAQSQSPEDPDLAKAEPYFYYERDSWALPSTEAEYQKGIDALHRYISRLNDTEAKKPGHFYSRADNLWVYMEVVIKRLGDLSTRLNAQSERYERQFKDPSKKKAAVGKTSWWDIDDIFWEARGASWALLHILKAIKYDFRLILDDKRATKTVDIMIHEMENALTPVLSPVILNGDGYGLFANYSLAMANYIARANAAALDLRDVMNRG